MENSRFKFRVWDKDRKCFFNDDEVVIYPNGEVSFFNADYDFAETVVNQCTGLKDKNGQLIYENDLIKCPSGIYRIAVDDFGLWVAICNNNPFEGVGEWSDMVKEYAFNQENVELEVLGNIHQNPELLKDEE